MPKVIVIGAATAGTAAGLSATRLQSCFLIHALHALVVDAVGIAFVAASVVAAVQAVG